MEEVIDEFKKINIRLNEIYKKIKIKKVLPKKSIKLNKSDDITTKETQVRVGKKFQEIDNRIEEIYSQKKYPVYEY
jgi:hypothetical protein